MRWRRLHGKRPLLLGGPRPRRRKRKRKQQHKPQLLASACSRRTRCSALLAAVAELREPRFPRLVLSFAGEHEEGEGKEGDDKEKEDMKVS